MPTRPSKLDPHEPLIDQWIEEDTANRGKQRHTARRIWQRLCEEEGADVSEATVCRYVRSARESRRKGRDAFLGLVWAPGEAQADFGEADFHVRGTRARPGYFVLSFPYSNVGLAQVFPGENAECVCEGPGRAFEFVGGVPSRIVFDDAAGVGRRVGERAGTTEPFGARLPPRLRPLVPRPALRQREGQRGGRGRRHPQGALRAGPADLGHGGTR